MKTLLILLISSLLLFGHSPNSNHGFKEPVATCYGYAPCNACKNCTYCKYCNSGGTCGICSSKTTKSAYKASKPIGNTPKSVNTLRKPVSRSSKVMVSSRCKATTQKGTRCKRGAGKSGYCWQHGR